MGIGQMPVLFMSANRSAVLLTDWPFLMSVAVRSSIPSQSARKPDLLAGLSRSRFFQVSNSVASVPHRTAFRSGLPAIVARDIVSNICSTAGRLLKKLSSVPKKYRMPSCSRSRRISSTIRSPLL